MSSTTALTGMLPFMVLVASGLAFPVCFFLLMLYRRSVQKGMTSASVGEPTKHESAVPPRAPCTPLRIVEMNADADGDNVDVQTYRAAVFGPWCACAVYAIAGVAYAVLMDLRSFSQANQGCIFELGRLVDRVDLNRVIFLVDRSTDRNYLESTLQRLWQRMSTDSPNRCAVSPMVRLFNSERQSDHELTTLLRLLVGTAATSAAA